VPRLFAYGCSNTYGHGLPDCWINGNFGPEPSKLSWPQLVADKLGLECVNLGKSGASIKYMANKALETEYQEGDIAVFLWTYFSRYCFFQNYGKEEKRLQVQDWNDNSVDHAARRYSKKYFYNFYTHRNAIIDGYMRINFIKHYLDNKGIKNYHYTCHEISNGGMNLKIIEPTWNRTSIMFREFSYIDKALDRQHPGVKSQEQMAEEIYKDILERSNV
jgi:hypothetical protein